MESNDTQFLWVEKYRPHKIADCVLPDSLKDTFLEYIKNGNIPNILFTGSPGTGKTTAAKALCEEIGIDWMFINGSSERGIDVLRNKITTYASSMSFGGGRKCIIIDEADNLTDDCQRAMRAAIEEFSSNCTFILTCNYVNKIIPALHSRFAIIEFKLKGTDKAKMASAFFKRIGAILLKEGIAYKPEVVIEVIQKHFPDYRRILNELQRYSVSGSIDIGILTNLSDDAIRDLIGHIKNKDFGKMRRWVGNNVDQDMTKIYRKVYDSLYDYLTPESIPSAVLIIAEYSYRHAFVADPEVNAVACFTQMMADCGFK